MRGIFIRVKDGEKSYHKDLLDSGPEQRKEWYLTLSKG